MSGTWHGTWPFGPWPEPGTGHVPRGHGHAGLGDVASGAAELAAVTQARAGALDPDREVEVLAAPGEEHADDAALTVDCRAA